MVMFLMTSMILTTSNHPSVFAFCIAFHIFVAGNRRDFKFGTWVEHSKSQSWMTNCPSNGCGHVMWSSSNFGDPTHIRNGWS